MQGVGFRQFIKMYAKRFALTGWVCNRPDGSVEAIFQSLLSSNQEAKQQIEKMIALCRKGPMLAGVEEVTIIWEEQTATYTSFDIPHSI